MTAKITLSFTDCPDDEDQVDIECKVDEAFDPLSSELTLAQMCSMVGLKSVQRFLEASGGAPVSDDCDIDLLNLDFDLPTDSN